MTYQVTVEEHPHYLHVIGSGDRTEQNMRRFLIDTHQAAMERNKKSLLLDVRFLGRSLNLGSTYAVIADRSPAGGMFKRIAYVDANYERASEDVEFAQLAAQNRGVNVRLFQNLAEAKKWVQEPPTDD